MITFEHFVAMFADHPENHHAIIDRDGRIIIQGRYGGFTYDTVADFARAHAPESTPSTASTTSTPQPLQPS